MASNVPIESSMLPSAVGANRQKPLQEFYTSAMYQKVIGDEPVIEPEQIISSPQELFTNTRPSQNTGNAQSLDAAKRELQNIMNERSSAARSTSPSQVPNQTNAEASGTFTPNPAYRRPNSPTPSTFLPPPQAEHTLRQTQPQQPQPSNLQQQPQIFSQPPPQQKVYRDASVGTDFSPLLGGGTVIREDKEVFTDNTIEDTTCCPCLTSRFWNKFFRISSGDLFKRIGFALVFFRPSLVDEISTNPDLYGPFWIYSTLILVLASSGNLSTYFMSTSTVVCHLTQ